jgi:hypothetical protein
MSAHRRVLDFERRWTNDAAATVTAVPPARLIAFAEARAGDAPVRDIDSRDFGRELREELADARNYAVWWLEQIGLAEIVDTNLAADISRAIAEALAATAVAFEHADRAHDLAIDLLPRAA